MEVIYCTGCGSRIDAPDVERGEVARVLDDCYCLKCAHAKGFSLAPKQSRPTGSTTRPATARAKPGRAPRALKAPNVTAVIIAVGGAFLGAAICGLYLVRSRARPGKTARKRTRAAGPREKREPAPPETKAGVGASRPTSLFAPRRHRPAEDGPGYTPAGPAQPRPLFQVSEPESQKADVILAFDFEEGIPEGWDGELETETLPVGSTKALRARDRGNSYFYAGHTGTDQEYFRATPGTRVSFDCRSSHAVTLQVAMWCESPEEKGNFWKDIDVPAEEWKRFEVRVMDLVRDESGNAVRDRASCRMLKFKLFKSPPGLKFVIDNVEVFETPGEVGPRGPAVPLNAGPAGEIPEDALVFTPTADTYVNPRAPLALGTRDRLEIGAGVGEGIRRTAYLRFEVKDLPGKVLSTRLRLYCVNASAESGGTLYAGEGGWDEATLAFESRSDPNGEPSARLGPVSIDVEYELDLTPLVGGEGVVELILDSKYEDGAGYGAREGAHPPRLVIVCEGPREERSSRPEPPAEGAAFEMPPATEHILRRVADLVGDGRMDEAREASTVLGGRVAEVVLACIAKREELVKLAGENLVETGRDEQLRLQFGKMPLKGFVAGLDGWKLWIRTPQGASVPADIRKLAMEDVVRYSGLDRNSPEGARALGRAWLVQGNAAQALANLSVAKVGGVEVSAEMALARMFVKRPAPTPKKAPPGKKKERELPRRVTSGLIAYYPFDEGKGEAVNDRSGAGAPLNLRMTGVVRWLRDRNGVDISSSSVIRTAGAAAKLHAEIVKKGQVTFEVWCKPANTVQKGPARILSYSKDGSHRNFTLGQQGTGIQVRLRTTTSTSANARPYMDADAIVTTEETHFVVTYAAEGTKRLYKNGVEAASMARTGTVENWDISYPFVIGNEATADRTWLGKVYLAAVYNRELKPEEVLQNYKAGSRAVEAAPAVSGAAVLRPGRAVKQINFQPKSARTPAGYEPDSGGAFDEKRGYGWTDDHTRSTRLRSSKEPVLGTNLSAGTHRRVDTWELKLANGLYFVSLVCGDSKFEQGPHGVKAEGVKLIWEVITPAGKHVRAEEIPVEVRDGRLTLEVGADGSNLIASDDTSDTTLCSLVVHEAEAVRGADSGGRLWFAAGRDATRLSGAAKAGAQYASGDDLDTARDSLEQKLVYMAAAAGPKDRPATDADHACYAFRLEKGAECYLWGRMYFPGAPGSNDPNSFWARADDGPARKYGNSHDAFRKWHWGGDGEKERGKQGPVRLGRLAAGVHQLLVINREGEGARLDALCIAPDASYVPSDGDALKPLRKSIVSAPRPQGGDWIDIFNGRDLAGWRGQGKTYVEDGALVAENSSDLYYAADWEEFILICEFTLSGRGDGAAGIGLGSARFGRGQWRVGVRFHPDGDAHAYLPSRFLCKSGRGKFPMDQWTPLKLELTREAVMIYSGESLLASSGLADAPPRKGGVYLYSDGGYTARIRNVRVRVLSR